MVDNDESKILALMLRSLIEEYQVLIPKQIFIEISKKLKIQKKCYQKLCSKIEECDSNIQDSSMTSNKKPLINKLIQYKSDLDIAKNKPKKNKQMENSIRFRIIKGRKAN